MKSLAKFYVDHSWTRFVNAVPFVGTSLHEYLVAEHSASQSRLHRRLFGLKGGTAWVICSELVPSQELEQSSGGVHYLSRCGDIYAFLDLMLAAQRVFPRTRVGYCSAREFTNRSVGQYADNLLLVGGPDYNEVTELFMEHSPLRFRQDGGDTVLVDTIHGQVYRGEPANKAGQAVDYGFFLKMRNPHNPEKSVFMFNGIRSAGVYASVKCFLSQDENEASIAQKNCELVLDRLGRDPCFAVILKVSTMNLMTSIPIVHPSLLLPLSER